MSAPIDATAWARETRGQHAAISRQADRLLQLLTMDFDWEDVSLSLAELEHALARHFAHEEQGNIFEMARSHVRRPEDPSYDEDSHEVLHAALRELRAAAEARNDRTGLAERFLTWLHELRAHEAFENHMLRDA